jgi:hypothetical protein
MFSLVTFYMLSLMNLVDEIMFCSYLVLGGIEFLSRFSTGSQGKVTPRATNSWDQPGSRQ